MSDESKPALTDAEQLAALRDAIAVVLKPHAICIISRFAQRAHSIDEVLIDLDAEIGRARAASRGYAAVGRYDLAVGEVDKVRELKTIAAALRTSIAK